MEEIKVSEMLQADSINKDDSVMIIQEGVNKKASGSIQTATGTSLSLPSVADTCKITSNSKNLFNESIVNNLWTFADGTISAWTGACIQKYNCSEGDTFTLKATYSTTDTQNNIIAMAFFDSSNTLIGRTANNTTLEITSTAPANTAYMYAGHYVGKPTTMQLEEGSTATSYNPYNTEVIITDGDVSSPIIEAGTIANATGQNATGSRMRSAGYIDVEPNKAYTLHADGNTVVVFEYKADNTYIHRIPDNWIKTPYTFITTSETAKVRFVTESPNVTQDQIAFQEGSQSQKITLTPQEEKSVFTYDTKTGVLSDGSVTIEYNTQSRLLNNNDTIAIKEYVDETKEELLENDYDVYSTDEKRIGTWKDGRPLYRKVIDYTIPSGTTSIGISLGVANMCLVQRAEVRFNAVGSGDYVFNSYYSSASDYMRFFMRSNELQIRLGSNTSGFNIVAIVEYTKSTD